MEERDLIKELDELLKPTDPPKEAALKNTAEAPSPISLESILPRLPPEGQRITKIIAIDLGGNPATCFAQARKRVAAYGKPAEA